MRDSGTSSSSDPLPTARPQSARSEVINTSGTCPRCSGDEFLDRDDYGWYATCIHCGHVMYPEVGTEAPLTATPALKATPSPGTTRPSGRYQVERGEAHDGQREAG